MSAAKEPPLIIAGRPRRCSRWPVCGTLSICGPFGGPATRLKWLQLAPVGRKWPQTAEDNYRRSRTWRPLSAATFRPANWAHLARLVRSSLAQVCLGSSLLAWAKILALDWPATRSNRATTTMAPVACSSMQRKVCERAPLVAQRLPKVAAWAEQCASKIRLHFSAALHRTLSLYFWRIVSNAHSLHCTATRLLHRRLMIGNGGFRFSPFLAGKLASWPVLNWRDHQHFSTAQKWKMGRAKSLSLLQQLCGH